MTSLSRQTRDLFCLKVQVIDAIYFYYKYTQVCVQCYGCDGQTKLKKEAGTDGPGAETDRPIEQLGYKDAPHLKKSETDEQTERKRHLKAKEIDGQVYL